LVFSPNPEYDHIPFVRAGLDQKVAPNTLTTLHGEDSYDYEGAVTYAWTQTGGSTVTLSSSTAASPTFTPTAEGTYRFSLVVTDSATQTSAADEAVVTVSSSSPPHATSYAYDGDGDRISQTNDGVTTSYVVNSVPKLAAVLMETTGSATTYYIYGQDLLYSLKADGPHYHHADSLGSTIAVTDSTGAVEQTIDYDIFGAMRTSTGASGTTYTFTGEENDASGLVYLRARYLDPAQGRFLSRDPYPSNAKDTQSINRYEYARNNPTNVVDPSGELFEMLWDALDLLPAPVKIRIVITVLPVILGIPPEASEPAARILESENDHVFGAIQAGGADADAIPSWDSVQLKMDHIFTPKHLWDEFGGASQDNVIMLKKLGEEYGADLDPGKFFAQTIDINGRDFYFGVRKSIDGILTVNDAYYLR
jgi:RHS repeat-associated protein